MGCDGPGFAAFTAGLVMGTGSTITIKVSTTTTTSRSHGSFCHRRRYTSHRRRERLPAFAGG